MTDETRRDMARLNEGAPGPHIVPRPAAPAIGELARTQLREHAHLRMQRVWCEVEGDVLYLRGQVPRFYYKQLAQEAVAGIDGVGQVVNEIEVVW